MSRRSVGADERTPLLKPPSGKGGSNSDLAVSASRRPPRPVLRSERGNASDAEGRHPPVRRQPRRKLVSESDVPRSGAPGGARLASRGGATTGSESESERSRRPYHYHQVPGTHRFRHDSGAEASDCEVASFNRFNYISKVMGGSSGRLAHRDSETGSEGEGEAGGWEPPHFTIPDHLIPAEFFIPYTPFAHAPRPGEESKNGSLITIFAIWNTMMGTSILSMPWLVEQSGFISSIATFIVMGIVCTFTAFRVLTMQKRLRIPPPTHDFQNIMRDVLSKHWEYLGILFSVAVLVGAMLVYWVLMTNFLYKSVDYFYDLAIGNFSKYDLNTTVINGAYCPENVVVPRSADVAAGPESFYDKIWNAHTAPLFLIFLLYPLLNIKSPTFFTKFTGMGTISVLYMIVFVTTKAVQFGIHVNFSDVSAFDYVQLFRLNFPVAMGTLSLAMFIHNCICRIMESNEHQEHNVRDLFVAYFLVFITYLYIGLLFFLAWPFAKTCIQDNFLDNFLGTDPMSIVARLFLFFQMCTVFPLLGFIIRATLMTFLYGTTYPGPGRVLLLNTALVLVCVAVAIFYPHIGQLLRFSGAFCGMAWIFTFPCVTYLVGAYRRHELRWPGALLHSALIALGVVNLVLQFVVKTD